MAFNTSWEKSAKTYHKNLGTKGDYYHQKLVLPNCLKLLSLKSDSKLLDLACGQGVLARAIPKDVSYTGVDVSPSLISFAKKQDHSKNHQFYVSDITRTLSLKETNFTHATLVLALQNLEDPQGVFDNACKFLQPQGKFLIVMNHPSFRIPRQSSWEIDPKNKLQYRRINRYLSPLKIPIEMSYGKQRQQLTWSFHLPLSTISKLLHDSGFAITLIEEWASDKESQGKAARMENRSRAEFPLFLTLLCQKTTPPQN